MAAAEKLPAEKLAAEEAVETETPGTLKPGAAPFGNFPHYSRFHPPEQRLRLLPRELLRQLFPPEGPERRPILGLDVGCNSGVSDTGGIGALGAPSSCRLQVPCGSDLGVASELARSGLLKFSFDRHVHFPALPLPPPPSS